jgi:hypothetical protein
MRPHILLSEHEPVEHTYRNPNRRRCKPQSSRKEKKNSLGRMSSLDWTTNSWVATCDNNSLTKSSKYQKQTCIITSACDRRTIFFSTIFFCQNGSTSNYIFKFDFKTNVETNVQTVLRGWVPRRSFNNSSRHNIGRRYTAQALYREECVPVSRRGRSAMNYLYTRLGSHQPCSKLERSHLPISTSCSLFCNQHASLREPREILLLLHCCFTSLFCTAALLLLYQSLLLPARVPQRTQRSNSIKAQLRIY